MTRLKASLTLSILVIVTMLTVSACILEDDPTSTPFPTPTATPIPPTPLPDDILIENTRRFLSGDLHAFTSPIDAEDDGQMAANCLDVIEGGPSGFDWSVEQHENGQWLVRVNHTASLIDEKTGTWLQIVGGGVGTTADSITCNDVPHKAFERDNPTG